jgi:hypothetical protein
VSDWRKDRVGSAIEGRNPTVFAELGAAWDALCECGRALDGVDGWQEVGLGRMYVEELFLLAGCAGGELAAEVFAEADRRASNVPELPLVVLQAAVDAARNVGDRSRGEHYLLLRDAEQERIDALPGGVGQCTALQGGGEGPRGRAAKARACPKPGVPAARCTGAEQKWVHHRPIRRSRSPTTSVSPASSGGRVRGTLAASAAMRRP